jgi:hypothetical protein
LQAPADDRFRREVKNPKIGTNGIQVTLEK